MRYFPDGSCLRALSLKDPEADRLAREAAARTGETLTAAVIVALGDRLARLKGKRCRRPLRDELRDIARRWPLV